MKTIFFLLYIVYIQCAEVTVDAGLNLHKISPLIYGINAVTSEQLSAAKISMSRWGGNRMSRYNYKTDTTNTGLDYFFENIPGCWSNASNFCQSIPSDPQSSSAANAFIQQVLDAKISTFFLVLPFLVKSNPQLPTMGYVSKAPKYSHPFDCGFPVSQVGPQNATDPHDINCGNGISTSGSNIVPPDPTTTSIAIGPSWNYEWVAYLKSKFGPSQGRIVYTLDNEPNLWPNTHRDVHPGPVTFDEIWEKMRSNAVEVLDADPTALIAGPSEWGWTNYFCSTADNTQYGCESWSPDRAKHNGTDLSSWLLQQARIWEQETGKRILHYFDLHYYAQGGSNPQRTRSLWDPNYQDPSWINNKIRLIPRMKEWVSQNYPNTKISLSEFDFGDHKNSKGVVALAEALGIFGREGLDAATIFHPFEQGDISYAAYVAYTNYDGNGHGFEQISCLAQSNSDSVQVYAAYGNSGLTVVICNEELTPVTVNLNWKNFTATSNKARVYTPTGEGSNLRNEEISIYGEGTSLNIGGMTFSMFVLPGNSNGSLQPDSPTPATTGATQNREDSSSIKHTPVLLLILFLIVLINM